MELNTKIRLEESRSRVKEGFASLQPYNHRALTRPEIEIRNSIIREILSAAREFRAVECGLAV
jgi:hypothetical protein